METIPKIKFYFHHQEEYFPSSFQYYVDNSKLYKKINDEQYKFIGKQSQNELANLNCNDDRNTFQLLADNDNIKKGFRDNLNNIPLYGFRNEINKKVYITLFLFYVYNGPYDILYIQEAGKHWGDMERIVLEYTENKLTRVYCGAHGDQDGRWLNIDEIEKEGEYMVFYIARNGHGFYPNSGIYWRIFGLANDHTEKGKYITFENYTNIPKKEVATKADLENIGLAYFCGLIGANGISSFMNKSWPYNIPIEKFPPKMVNRITYNIFFILLLVFLFTLLYFIYFLGIHTFKKYKYAYFVIVVISIGIALASLKMYIKNVSA